MILITILIVIIVIGICLFSSDHDGLNFFGIISILGGGLILIALLIAIPMNRYDNHLKLEQLKAFQLTITEARENNLSEIERAAILSKIAEWNEWIAATKYDNAHIWDIWVIDDIDTIELIN